jgi:hypothetical protein
LGSGARLLFRWYHFPVQGSDVQRVSRNRLRKRQEENVSDLRGKNHFRFPWVNGHGDGNNYHRQSFGGYTLSGHSFMDIANVVELLDDLRGTLVRSIEAQEHQEHELATRLLKEAKDKFDDVKILLKTLTAAGGFPLQ